MTFAGVSLVRLFRAAARENHNARWVAPRDSGAHVRVPFTISIAGASFVSYPHLSRTRVDSCAYADDRKDEACLFDAIGGVCT